MGVVRTRLLKEWQRNGSDAKEWMPSAYIRGSIDTSAQEAQDITGVAMDPRKEILYQTKAKTSKLGMIGGQAKQTYEPAQAPAACKDNQVGNDRRCRLLSSGLRSAHGRDFADISTINDIHAAYIHGSVPTAAQESDDIMNMPYPDEVRESERELSACDWNACRGTALTLRT
eukprot:763889-Hanusia_phi.AAC.1